MKIKSQEAAAQVVQEFQEQIEKLKAFQYLVPGFPAEGYVLQFENGLAVKIKGPGECAVSAIYAASVYVSPAHAKQVPEVKNGHGEIAQPVKLFEACAKEIAKLEGFIAQIKEVQVAA